MSSPRVFEEWDAYVSQRQLIDREINLEKIIDASNRKIVAITGIRRSGKSSLLMLIRQMLAERGEKVAYINLEDDRINTKPHLLDDALKWFGDEGTLLLDEVTAAKDHEGWLSRSHELLKDKLRIIITSSRASLTTPSKPLRGRIYPFELYPLSFAEYLSFKKIDIEPTTAGRGRLERSLLEYLQFGGFPEVSLTSNDTEKVAILGGYLRDIVGLDIAEVSSIDLATVKAFTDYALQTPTFSASKTLQFLKALGHKLGKDRILSLERYTESSYLIHYLHLYSRNIKDRAQYPRKAYPGDTGFAYALSGRLDMGRLAENAVLLHLRRRNISPTEVNYWKDHRGAETDFVIRRGNTAEEAIQVTWDLSDPRTYKREVNGLAKCASELSAEKATIITNGEEGEVNVNGVEIYIKPITDWLATKTLLN
jgi:predicted AAA+ superfamily ATPase